jgi:hypothetical protein
MKIAEQSEQVGQRKLPSRTVRETLTALYREIYNDNLPTATVRHFIENCGSRSRSRRHHGCVGVLLKGRFQVFAILEARR